MSLWTIEPIPLYRFASPGPEVLFQRRFGEMIEMVIYAFMLRSERLTVLVDTGLPSDFRALNENIRLRKGPKSGFEPLESPSSRLLDASPDLIVVTSFGPYAVGGLDRIAGPVLCSERGLRDLRDPEEPALAHPIPAVHGGRLREARTVAGSAEIAPGLTFVEVGVHHPASAALCVGTSEGTVALADPVFVRENLTDGVALGAAEHAAGWFDMVRRLGETCDAILPIHDIDPRPLAKDDWHANCLPSARA